MGLAFSTGVSTSDSTSAAAEEALEAARRGMDGRRPDLALLFLTPQHLDRLDEAQGLVQSRTGALHVLGCLGQGVICDGRELEKVPALCVWLACLPGVEVRPARLQAQSTSEGLAFLGLPEVPEASSTLLVFGDPYSFPAVELMGRLEEDHPALQVIGGMASGGLGPGQKALLLDGEVLGEGAVGVVLAGPLRVRPVVSQGCRPFGKHLVVTRAEENVILELGGRPALERLREEIGKLSPEEGALLKHGLHLGRAIDPRRQTFGRGDFLIRNVVGVDPRKGVLAITDAVRPGQTVQFHLRDARSASEDLSHLLAEARQSGARPAGALLFSCNGRGSYLFSTPDHDAGAVRREMGQVPLAGFFAAGELGPIGGRNFLHGFTASLAFFEEPV